MTSTNNSSNPNSQSQITQSWAHTLSDYLLQRRSQTQFAYQKAFGDSIGYKTKDAGQGDGTLDDEQNTDWIFKAVFIALAQQLEEGHTVLTLSSSELSSSELGTEDIPLLRSSDSISIEEVAKSSVQLAAWQLQLLTILLSPLADYIDNAVIPKQMIDELSEATIAKVNISLVSEPLNQIVKIVECWPQVETQLALSPERKKVLMERYNLGKKLIGYFNDDNQSRENSLSKFIKLIQQNNLFSKAAFSSDSQSNTIESVDNSTPVRYTVSKLKNSLSITFWIYRTWQAEYTLAKTIKKISEYEINALPIVLNEHLNTEQQAAINMANSNAFSIITGGPGTGKTYTVAQLVMALKNSQLNDVNSKNNKGRGGTKEQNTSLALAAPTGKAAQRMQESLQVALDAAGVSIQLQEAKTIHRLLGIGQSGRPRYHADNPLSEDIVIVDEASMLGVELANQLVSAIKPKARLILLGDANQLAAVDAGAVLADLCRIPMLQSMHQQLIASRRFSEQSGIGQLAKLINAPEADMRAVWQVINDDEALAFYPVNRQVEELMDKSIDSLSVESFNEFNTINSLSNQKLLIKLTQCYLPYINQIKEKLTTSKIASSVPNSKDVLNNRLTNDGPDVIATLMQTLNQFRILTAGHHGRWGDHALNDYISQWHIGQLKLPISNSPWFHGRPVMVLQNSYEMGLFNGDIGICLQTDRGLEVFFENKSQGIAVNLLNEEMIATAYAMTIHKSQGSEFDHVAITFDDSNSRLLSKELIYTAVTRAKRQVSIYSTRSALTKAIKTPTLRQTGLALQFDVLKA